VAGGIRLYGITDDFSNIQPFDIWYGRFLAEAEFSRGSNTAIVGHSLAETLFGSADAAVNKTVMVRGQRVQLVGVLKKQGTQLIGGWGFDQSVVLPYRYARTIMNEHKADPLILVQGKATISSKALKEDLTGTMRTLRRLRPAEEDNFSLNDVSDFSEVMSKVFVSVNLGGWIIGALAFIVGIFGVANIMFVTVKERTSQIGLKKALGAKRSVILTEFLLESAFLCILGGLIGLLLVFILTKVATAILEFPIFLSPGIIGIAITICIVAGIAAGIIPAIQASRMNPVEAIRS
jgi:putative ABC transport system permease protein